MAKAIQAFIGKNIYGRWVEVAQRADGQWFERYQENSKYGLVTTRWAKSEEPDFLTRERNAYSGEYIDLPAGKYISWGFGKLERIKGKLTYRLPN